MTRQEIEERVRLHFGMVPAVTAGPIEPPAEATPAEHEARADTEAAP